MECQCCISFHLVCHVMGMHRPVWHRGAVLFLSHTHMDRIYQTRSPMVLHASFVLILCGAGLTALTAKSGRIHCEPALQNARIFRWACALRTASLPFAIRLKQFTVNYHPGTHSASNYVSKLCVNNQYEVSVSMNRVATIEGCAFTNNRSMPTDWVPFFQYSAIPWDCLLLTAATRCSSLRSFGCY